MTRSTSSALPDSKSRILESARAELNAQGILGLRVSEVAKNADTLSLSASAKPEYLCKHNKMLNIGQMNFMIWSVALMYIYWMVIRDLMIPVAYSELVDKDFRDRLVKTTMTQSSILGVFTYVTALFFLAMYYYFANT